MLHILKTKKRGEEKNNEEEEEKNVIYYMINNLRRSFTNWLLNEVEFEGSSSNSVFFIRVSKALLEGTFERN